MSPSFFVVDFSYYPVSWSSDKRITESQNKLGWKGHTRIILTLSRTILKSHTRYPIIFSKKMQNCSIWSCSPHATELLHLPVVWSALSPRSLEESIRAVWHGKHTGHISKYHGEMWDFSRREQCCSFYKSHIRSPHVNKASKGFQKANIPVFTSCGMQVFSTKAIPPGASFIWWKGTKPKWCSNFEMQHFFHLVPSNIAFWFMSRILNNLQPRDLLGWLTLSYFLPGS